MFYEVIETASEKIMTGTVFESFNLAKKESNFTAHKIYIRKCLKEKNKVIKFTWKLFQTRSQPYWKGETVTSELNKALSMHWDVTLMSLEKEI